MKEWEKYERALQNKIEVLGRVTDRQLFHDYYELTGAKSKEELLQKAKKLRYSEVKLKEDPFVMKVSRDGNTIEFREAFYVKYMLMIREKIKQLHEMGKFEGFYLVFPNPIHPVNLEELKDIPLSYLFNPAEQRGLFGENWVRIMKIYREDKEDKQTEIVKTLDVAQEIRKTMEFYLENAYHSRFGLIFYRPTYPYIQW